MPAPPSFHTVRAAGVVRGEPWRMWWQAPDRVRLEVDVPGGTEVRVQVRPHWWLWSPEHGARTNDGDGSLIDLGPQVYLLDPRRLLASALLELVGEEEVAGRRAATVKVRPRWPEKPLQHPVDWVAAGEVAVDVERGVLLRTREIEAAEMGFDEELPEGAFGLHFGEGVEPRHLGTPTIREVSLGEAVESAGFPLALPRLLPAGARLLRCVQIFADVGPSMVLEYLVDPGGIHSLTIQQGPGLAETVSEPGWRPLRHEGIPLRVRELGPGAVPPREVLAETAAGHALVRSDLPVEIVAAVAVSLEPRG
jgi:hypothetical protein